MENKKLVRRESLKALAITAITGAALGTALAATGHFSVRTAGGIITGIITGMANFCLLAITVAGICSGYATAARAKLVMKKSYALRMLMMTALSVIAIMLVRVNPLTHALMLPVPCIAVRAGRKNHGY